MSYDKDGKPITYGPHASQPQGASELKGIVIPQSYLDDLEKSRIAVFELFPDADVAMSIRLQNITEPMFKLTHRRWPAI